MSMIAAYQDEDVALPRSSRARAAILLLAMGSSGASRVLKHLAPSEIKMLHDAAGGLEPISPEQIDLIVEIFQEAFRKGPGVAGPGRQMNELLQKALSEEEFEALFPEAAAELALEMFEEEPRSVWDAVADMQGEILAPQLAKEHPHVVAILLSKIPAVTASSIVREFDPGFRNSVMRRMLTLKPLSQPVLNLFETHVRQAYLGSQDSPEQTGTHAVLADIVNRLEKRQADELLDAVRKVRPRDAENLQKLLFSFDDLGSLPQKSRLTLFDAIPTEVTILALRGAAADMKECVLSALGARARRMAEAELSREADLQASEVDGARRRIADEALRLSGEGRIQLRAMDAA
jgi:flagellar motor switch protein FliG